MYVKIDSSIKKTHIDRLYRYTDLIYACICLIMNRAYQPGEHTCRTCRENLWLGEIRIVSLAG